MYCGLRDGSGADSRADFFVSAIDQRTVPEELPVSGDPDNETTLELIFPGRQPRFKLNGKRLQLLEPLDRDDENLSHVVFQVTHFLTNLSTKLKAKDQPSLFKRSTERGSSIFRGSKVTRNLSEKLVSDQLFRTLNSVERRKEAITVRRERSTRIKRWNPTSYFFPTLFQFPPSRLQRERDSTRIGRGKNP